MKLFELVKEIDCEIKGSADIEVQAVELTPAGCSTDVCFSA